MRAGHQPAREPGDRPAGETSFAEGERPGYGPTSALPAAPPRRTGLQPAIAGAHGVSSMFIRPVSFLAAAGLGAGIALPVFADDSKVETEVVVTATRVPTPIDEVLAPVIVIDQAAIDRSAPTDASDLLRFHAGLDIARNGGPGQTTSVFIRGADSNHTLVLLDGVRMNPGTIGIAALQNIPPDMIERIEVVKGPRSALWGSDAIGGVINVITRRGTRDGWSAEAGYGDYDTRKASLNGGVPLGTSAGFDFGVSWTDSNGFPTLATDHTDRGFDNLSFSANLSGTVGSAELALRHWSASGTTEYSDFFVTPVDQDFSDSTTAATIGIPVTERGQANATFSHYEDRIDQNQPPFPGAPKDYLRTKRDTADVSFDWTASKAQSLSAGAMYSREKASSSSFGDLVRSRHELVESLRAGPHRGGPAQRAAGARLHRPRDGRQCVDLERRVRLRNHRGDPRVRTRGQRLSRTRRHRPLRVRRQSGPEARRVAELRARRAPFDRRQPVRLAFGVSQRDRRPDRVRRAGSRHVRRPELQRGPSPDRGHRSVVALRGRSVAGLGRGDLPGSAEPDRRHRVAAPRQGEPDGRPWRVPSDR